MGNCFLSSLMSCSVLFVECHGKEHSFPGPFSERESWLGRGSSPRKKRITQPEEIALPHAQGTLAPSTVRPDASPRPPGPSSDIKRIQKQNKTWGVEEILFLICLFANYKVLMTLPDLEIIFLDYFRSIPSTHTLLFLFSSLFTLNFVPFLDEIQLNSFSFFE